VKGYVHIIRTAAELGLETVQDPRMRQELFQSPVDQAYEQGKALNIASYLEIDQVIDPGDTREWISRGIRSMPPRAPPLREKAAGHRSLVSRPKGIRSASSFQLKFHLRRIRE
jgi:acetyl-CoA carboxylase carboxyltransferase component